jgi:sRNA-binding carbon storage regulator CsrA
MLVLQEPNRRGTLALQRKIGEAIVIKIGEHFVRVLIGKGTTKDPFATTPKIKLIINAPRSVDIWREELEQKRSE